VSIRALIVDPSAPERLRLTEAPEPMAGSSQVLLDVHHVSLNYGDLNDVRSGRVPQGAVLGSDAAGVVAQSAADGSGPGVGTRVVAFAPASPRNQGVAGSSPAVGFGSATRSSARCDVALDGLAQNVTARRLGAALVDLQLEQPRGVRRATVVSTDRIIAM
jgi:NADPH:quinone reductase-like Zn-dependent oxidoreductase